MCATKRASAQPRHGAEHWDERLPAGGAPASRFHGMPRHEPRRHVEIGQQLVAGRRLDRNGPDRARSSWRRISDIIHMQKPQALP
jgi:hypothetical protein